LSRYNSIIYDTLGSNEYVYAFVTPAFFTGGTWDPSGHSGFGVDYTSFADYQTTPNSLVRLENKECIEVYAANYVSQYSDVIIVTDTQSQENVSCVLEIGAEMLFPSAAFDYSGAGWFYSAAMPADLPNTPPNALSYADNWTLEFYVFSFDNVTKLFTSQSGLTQVQYCLANPSSTPSYIEINPGILTGVIVCNVVKLICFATTLFWVFRDHDPLITTGDAIHSFLAKPEPDTAGNSILTARDVEKGSWKKKKASTTWKSKRHFWFVAASIKRWISITIF
jgi:hypothetical protein